MLKKYVAVYVPGTKDKVIPLSAPEQSAYVSEVARDLSLAFGGATAESAAKGYWVDSTGHLIAENIVIVKSYHDNDNALEIVKKIANWLKEELTQEAITIETEEGIEFI